MTTTTRSKKNSSSRASMPTIEGLPVACVRVNSTGNIDALNSAALALLSGTKSDLLGKRIWTVVGAKKQTHPVYAVLKEGKAREVSTLVNGHVIEWNASPCLDEDGEVTGAMVVLRKGCKTSDTVLRAVAGAGTAFMLIDENFEIVHVNAATRAILESNEQAFNVAFPGLNLAQLEGTCIDVFHKNPGRIRRLLSDPQNLPHRADIQVEDLTFELYVTAILDEEGNIANHCLEWKDVTEERSAADNASRLHSLVEGAGSYFVITDRDANITYANPSAMEMFRRYADELREAFPSFSPDTLVGSNIDVFHKNPKHQRDLLGDPSRLPFKTEIEVAGLNFGLVAVALHDRTGRHIGSGVEWVDHNARSRYRREIERLLNATKAGRLSERGDLNSVSPEYHFMLNSFNEILDSVVSPIRIFQQRLENMAKGDLKTKITADLQGDHAVLKTSLNATLDSLNETLVQVRDVAATVASGSEEVSDAAQALAQGATEQASALHQITSTMARTTEQTKKNAESASEASELSSEARSEAENGDRMMKSMVSAMADIEESSHNIRKIIKVIDEIAFQTNLLALNAAVEAARAGVHGKGFAVVAEEVRSLAARSATAAKETTDLIESSIQKVKMGTDIANNTAEALGKIVDDVGKVTSIVHNIASASNEQAQGIGEMNLGLSQVDRVTQTNTASAEESASASHELSSQANELNHLLERFDLRSGQDPLGALPGNLPADVLSMLEGVLAANQVSAPQPTNNDPLPELLKQAAGSDVSVPAAQPHANPAQVIALDDSEFGKY